MSTLPEAVFFARNLIAARALIKSVPRTQVDLDAYVSTEEKPVAISEQAIHKCGAVACLGGWVAVAPYFQALGVSPGAFGEPILKPLGIDSVGDVAKFLFGDSDMFNDRNGHELDAKVKGAASDKKVATHRLNRRLKQLAKEHPQIEGLLSLMWVE